MSATLQDQPKRTRHRRRRRKSKLLVVYEDALDRACELGNEESLDRLGRALRNAIGAGVFTDMFVLLDAAFEGKKAERYLSLGNGTRVVDSPRFRTWRLVQDIATRELYRSWSAPSEKRPALPDKPQPYRQDEVRRSVAVSRPREHRSTRQAKSASSSSTGSSDDEPAPALGRLTPEHDPRRSRWGWSD